MGQGWLEMESIEIDDRYIEQEQLPSATATATELKEEVGAYGSMAAGVANPIKRHQCPICGVLSSSRANLRRHMLVHTKQTPLMCAICGKGILRLCSLQRHMRTVYSDERPFACTLCQSRFKLQFSLATHMKKTHGETPETEPSAVAKDIPRHQCPICGVPSSSRTNLRRHMLVHTKQRPRICAVCGKGIIRLDSLKRHMKMVHGQIPEKASRRKNSKQHQCKICLRAFTNRGRLRSHMRVHIKQERVVCITCGKSYQDNSALMNHQAVHSSEKPFKCERCTTTFKYQSTMLKHMRRFHGIGELHRCQQCSSLFTSVKRLTQHQETRCESMVATRNRKNHFCPQCGKGFVTKDKLTVHMVTHSDERPFACSEYDFTAKHRYYLTLHQRRHTGELFKCAQCDYAHPKKAELDRHSKVHANKH